MGFKEEIVEYIKSGETKSQRFGLEVEHFIINEKGDQISFGEISGLIQQVGEAIGARLHYMDGFVVGYNTDSYSTSLEPACQFEISINPYSDLETIRRVYEDFLDLWTPIFKERGYHFAYGGNLPKVELGKLEPIDIPLSPKKRYKYMDAYFDKSGKYGRHMMRASASTQVSIDFSSEKDMVRKLQLLEKISPILMMMMENKAKEDSVFFENDTTHLFRIQEWDNLDGNRTGFVPYSFEKDFGYEKMADVIYNTPLILLYDNGETTYVGDFSAKDLVEKKIISDAYESERKKRLIEHVMSMGFFHFRIKKYIEIRVADSVPIEKALSYVALIKGLFHSEESIFQVEKELESVDSTTDIQHAVEEIEHHGWEAIIYDGRSASDWLDYLKAVSSLSLDRKEREYLNYV